MSYYVAQASPNIAFLKYWGRLSTKPRVAASPSLSMCLSESVTTTVVSSALDHDSVPFHTHQNIKKSVPWTSPHGQQGVDEIMVSTPDHQSEIGLQVLEQACHRMAQHVTYMKQHFGLWKPLHIWTQNSFVMGSGLASSASGFAALSAAVGACLYEDENFHLHDTCLNQLAHLSREGSGSAARCIHGGYVSWIPQGENPGQIIQEYSSDHWDLHDTIVVLSSQIKNVSSSAGHQLASTSPLFAPKISRSHERWQRMKDALRLKDISRLGELMESEALEMHGVAMTSSPPIFYVTDQTLKLVSWIAQQRLSGVFKAYFTIDAGPNVHIISESHQVDRVTEALDHAPCSIESVIYDRVGDGVKIRHYDDEHSFGDIDSLIG